MKTLALSPALGRSLKARAHHLVPVVIIGDAGLTPAVLREIDVHLKSHELIKIRVSGDDRDARLGMIGVIGENLGANLVQHIGNILVVLRPQPPEPLKKPGKSAPPSTRKRPARNGARRTKRSFQGSS